MSNASLPNLITTFNEVLWSFNYIVLPICFILGNIGNCLNLLIFSQRSSRTNSCLLYFLSSSIVNIFILNFGLLLRILRGIWNIDPALKSLWFCRWRTYLTSTFFLVYRLSILLACIDRMCASSRNAWIRMKSQPRVAYYLIAFIWILCFVYFIPALVYHTLIYGQCLAPPASIYATYLTISTLVQGLLIPSIMILCGLITFTHLKSMQKRIIPMNNNVHDERKVVSQYIIMLFIQVATDCLCNLLYSIYLICNLFFFTPQNTQIAAISSFLINMSFTLPYLNYSSGFYLHTLSSPAFRRKLLKLLTRIRWFQQCIRLYDDRHYTHTIPLVTMRIGNTTALSRPTI
ncbi:unnamed protein product [Rotaria sp. Silwood1]|nr:unnamed protein product [Rotaria sp. Silwood1]CAF1635784.1 unnamed protein product [Rotaria sp. Silwood1]